jgi:adenosylhomocysteine nucleosidase
MEPPRVLILTALESETRAVANALALKRIPAGVSLWKKENVIVAGVGLRAAHADRALAILSQHRPQLLVLAGLAGALDPDLRIGDIIIDSPLPHLKIPPGARAARIHQATKLLATPDAKRQLFQSTGCAAVEMEAAALAPLIASAGVPLLHVRAISDTATDSVDEDCLSLVDTDGRPKLSRAAGLILRRPSALPQLLRLQRDSSLALQRLGQTMRHLAASGWLPA